MTDEQPRPDQQPQAAEEASVEQAIGAESASDPTPAATAGADATTGDDHSVWMRPAVGENRRTSEVVGALAPEPAAVTPGAQPIDLAADPHEQPVAVAGDEAPELAPHQHGALVGAQAALHRDAPAGTRLDFHGATQAQPEAPRTLASRILPWVAVALALAVAAFGVVYAMTRKATPVVTESPSASPSAPEQVVDSDLMTAADANKMVAGAGWKVASTVDKVTAASPTKIACLTNTDGQPDPTVTRQRALTTSSTRGLAALHQVDGYANRTDARKAFLMRSQNLGTCGDVPTWIAGAATVKGLGDEATAITIAYQDTVTQYHTVVLSRTGTTLHAVDVTQVNKPLDTASVVKGAAAVVNRQCTRAKGQCATSPTVGDAFPPVSGTPGWLMMSDLPRVTPNAGQWSSTDTANVTTKGSGCEAVDLASVAGPVKREQRTFLMTQDSAAPQTFGIDQVVLTFKDPVTAHKFFIKLAGDIAACPSRTTTAKVSDDTQFQRRLGKITITGRTMQVQQSMGGAETARFRVAVAVEGVRVVYLVNNPTASYDLGKDRFNQVAVRAGERINQTA